MTDQEKDIQKGLCEPLAIIGMNCRFPGKDGDIEDVDSLYKFLIQQDTCIREIPKERWDNQAYFDPNREKPDKLIARKGGFLHSPQGFDAQFFKISAVEAKQMDPQHRIFLEVTLRALQHANITIESINNSNTGVFCGTSTHDYSQLNIKDNIEFNAYTLIGVANSAAAGRVAHFLNLKGPCMAIDTACSSSLSALYVAANALRNLQCRIAIVGGVHLNLCPDNFVGLTKANMLSAQDKCQSFAKDADGFARSEGSAVIIVKRLQDAVQDGDTIHAVINSVVMNQDGNDGTVFVAPNINAQIQLHQEAIRQSGLTAADINYIETHGTGTFTGDSVEFNAIREIHQGHHSLESPLVLGALKSQLGHTIAASGIAALIKAVLALKHETIPGNLHYCAPNSAIDPDTIPAHIPIAAYPFRRQERKRHAQICNFGFSGTNVSSIIEEAPPKLEIESPQDGPYCFVLSAQSRFSLETMIQNMVDFLYHSQVNLRDVCLTLVNCRDHFKFRCAIIATNQVELRHKLENQDYQIHKVSLAQTTQILVDKAEALYEHFIKGGNVRSSQTKYNKIDLPLYAFERKDYWHESRDPKGPSALNFTHNEPIAIIGMSCRLPKANNLSEFLNLLTDGKSGMSDIPLERWNNNDYYDPDPDALGRLNIKQLGLIDHFKSFDADFFGVSPREAKLMSPHLRVFLEASFHALENANLPLEGLKKSRTGVFVGCGTNEYPRALFQEGFNIEDLNIHFATGNVLNAIPGRVAYSFELQGPIQAIDTACSSSMTAIHNACVSLQNGDCDMALAGGINIILTPDSNITLSKARMLSPDSRCKTFSEDADGYARSEGCGVLVLKRLSQAILDKDHIHAVIKGSAVNSDGKSGGFTVPNGDAQEDVILKALAKSKLSPAEIDFIEAHGTGTPLADPIEVNTLMKIFSDHHTQENPLYLSSVKTNIGHCESAAGVTSVIKAILSLQQRTIYQHLNFTKLNPNIELKNTIIPLRNMEWRKAQGLRCAGVSSFGFSGANAHVILQESILTEAQQPISTQKFVLVISAKSEVSLKLLLNRYQDFLTNTKDAFANICFTAATGRTHFAYRVAIIADSALQAAEILSTNSYEIHHVKKDKNSSHEGNSVEALKQAYEQGFKIAWQEFFAAMDYNFVKIQLPLYEFQRIDHWYGDKDKIKDAQLPKDWCFQVTWEEQNHPQTRDNSVQNAWHFIGAPDLAASLSEQGWLLVNSQNGISTAKGIIFAAALNPASDDIEENVEFQKNLIKQLLNLVVSFHQQSLNPRLIVLTKQGIAELCGQNLNISNASLIGFCKTLSLELPQLSTTVIDVETHNGTLISQHILNEIRHNHSSSYEHLVAYRSGQRLVPRLQKLQLPNAKMAVESTGCYLITGGFGGLGWVSAQALLSAGARDIVLTSRQSIDSARRDAIKKLQACYPQASIRAVEVDVSDKECLQDVVQQIQMDAPLKGIIHAAGFAVKAPLWEHTEQDVDRIFSAKVKGAWYLHDLSKNLNLDFFIVYSSIASAFGSNKESVYSGANSFLDGLITVRHKLNLVGTAVQWGPWGEVGMSQSRSKDSNLKNALISNAQGHAFIKRLLRANLPQIIFIAPEYLKFMLDFVPSPMPGMQRDLSKILSEPQSLPQQDLTPWLNDYFTLEDTQRLPIVKQAIIEICSSILEISSTDEIDEEEGFFDLGFDSLMITELAAQLKRLVGSFLKINVNVGFNFSSIQKLATYLTQELNRTLLEEKKQNHPTISTHEEPLAIIGMSCRLPKAKNVSEFLELLNKGESGMIDIPLERWDNEKYYDPDPDVLGKLYIKQLGFIDNYKNFDAEFFNISPREAKLMSPHLRIFMETSFHAIEDANLSLESIKGSKTGVFVGCGTNEYPGAMLREGMILEDLNIYFATGNVLNALPGRVAYSFDFHGPIQAIDTACSSSMTAIHNACVSLQAGDCDMALAGGVNMLLNPDSNITLSKAKMLSPTSRCKTFSADADGYARSEGCGVIVLKRLSDAIRDDNSILAVVRGSAINSGGKSGGFTVPTGAAQEEVILNALAKAKLSPSDVDFIEVHGTGTPLADPIEANTIVKIFSPHHSADRPLYLSSVKTNIGHCEAASGVASVIKTILSLQERKIFKHLNFKKLNPAIELKHAVIPLNGLDWNKDDGLRSAGVSSFGFSGANGHLILQEVPKQEPVQRHLAERGLLLVSARSKEALELLLESYKNYLHNTKESFADICYTTATCRSHFVYRVALLADSAHEAAALLAGKNYTIHHIKREKKSSANLSNLEILKKAYEEGVVIDWKGYFQGLNQTFAKVKLPLYEFSRTEFWFGEKEKIKDELLPKNWCFHLQWEVQTHDLTAYKEFGNKWLFVGDKHHAQPFIKQGLELFYPEEVDSFTKFDGVLFAAALSPAPVELQENIERQQDLIKQLLDLLKRINEQSHSMRLIVLTTKGIAEFVDEGINVSNTPLLGFCKTLCLELPQFSTICIDADLVGDEQHAKQVLSEIHHNHGIHYEHVVAYNQGKRHVLRLKNTSLFEKRKTINGQGRYLITGGFGGLGLVTAQALLSAGARDVVLVSRTVDKPQQKDALKKISSFYPGAKLRALSMDITDRNQLRKLGSTINKDGLLRGIIHTAGAAIKAPLLDHTGADVDHLFSAKVVGGWNLHEFSKNLELDFFVVYSSIASAFGSNKESVYSGANAALDALIAERRRLGLVGTSVHWGPWGEVGMAQARSRDDNLKNALISNAQGHAFIKLILSSDVQSTIVISPEYLRFMLDFVPDPKPGMQRLLSLDLNTTQQANSQQNLSPWLTQYVELDVDQRMIACSNLVLGICRDILEVAEDEPLNTEEGFFEVGFDSLMITELAAKLKKVVGSSMKVTVSIGFNYPSMRKLAEHLHQELDKKLVHDGSSTIASREDDAIAIIGMSCSLPNAPDLAAFEKLLEEGLSGIKDIPLERWDNREYYDPNIEATTKSYVNKLGLIDNIKLFDANFFGISPREAKLMEPQQRIFLEGCYKVLENANYSVESLRGSLTGVFAGVGPNEYYAQLEQSGFSDEELSAYSITGNVLNLIPGRVAYTFDFKGPSISVDTACSSSLVAIHYACQSLKNREINYALAGGVNILLRPESNVTLCRARALSPEGLCKTFDERADGYARAEGCGVVFLKRLADAVRDHDHILAVIKGSAVNNDGRSAGLTVPNGKSQEEVMLQALKQSSLHHHDIGYVEAHGTGTPLGDPIEVHAINKVYGKDRNEENPLYLGTVKTNIGHLESAAGVAGVIKAVIGLRKKKIYKILNFNKINPNINLETSRIPLQNLEWQSQEKLNCTGVNAFGFSGTNAHIILQEYKSPHKAPTIKKSTISVLLISAKSKVALENLVNRYQEFLETTEYDFADICFTAAVCRDHYPFRLAVAADTAKNASLALIRGDFALSGKNTIELEQERELNVLLLNYLQGEDIDWSLFYQIKGYGRKVTLPNYVFDGLEFWPDKKIESNVQAAKVHPLLGQMMTMPGNEVVFSHKLNLLHVSYLHEHHVFDRKTFLGMAFVEMGLAAAKLILGNSSFRIEGFYIERPLLLKENQELQVQIKPQLEDQYKLQIFAKHSEQWQAYAGMEILGKTINVIESIDIAQLIATFPQRFNLADIYQQFADLSLAYGTQFQVLQEGYVAGDQVLTRIALHKHTHSQGYMFHPILLDGALQSVFLFSHQEVGKTYVPYAFSAMEIFQEAPKQIWAHLQKNTSTYKEDLCFDIKLYDNAGLLVASIEELKLRVVNRNNFIAYESALQHLYYTQWKLVSLDKGAKNALLWTVISKDETTANRLFSECQYELIANVSELDTFTEKNIVFLFSQGEFDELFSCFQKMFEQIPKRFILVTQQAYSLNDEEPVNPYHTMANSLWKTFCNESGLHNSYAVDVNSQVTLQNALQFIINGQSQEQQFAIRDALYVSRLKRKQLSLHDVSEEKIFAENASYLIVGGTGGLAKLLIEYLIQRGVKHLFLVSRSPCSLVIKELMERQKQAVEITHITADAADYECMEKLIQTINQSNFPLRGVFHLAGVLHDGLMINLSAQDNRAVLNAKMESALILHQLTQALPLDLFVLFSSSASILGAKGQANYAAANGFLDGLAHMRRQQRLPAISINWGPFAGIGMAALLTQALEQYGFISLEPSSIEILDVLLRSSLTQIAPCPIRWEIYSKHSLQQIYLADLIKKKTAADAHFLNALRQLATDERIAVISQSLCEISADVLGEDAANSIRTTDSLFAMGLDSLMSMEIRNRIHDKLQCPLISLPIEFFINDPSVRKIAEKIALELEIFFSSVPQTSFPSNQWIEEAPLSDFQYVFWALDGLNISFNIGTQLILHGKINQDYVAKAMEAVVQQHAAFWLNFDKEIPFQRYKQQGEFKLIAHDVSLKPESFSLDKEYLQNIHRLIPLNAGPLIRVYLYKINNDLHQLHIVIPHIIVDDWSCNIVLEQFKRNYALLVQGKGLPHQPPKESYLNFVHHHLQRHEHNLPDKIEFWRNYNRGFEMLSLGSKHHLLDAAGQEKNLFHYPIDNDLVEQFFAWHKNKNINISSGLVAASQLVFYKLGGQQKIPIILIHSGREGSKYKAVVGLFSEYKRINTTVNEQGKFIDCIEAVEQELLKTAPYQKCSHFIKDKGLKGFELTFGQHLLYLINKLRLRKRFEKTQLHEEILDTYIGYLSRIVGHVKTISWKSKINKIFKTKLSLQKPDRLRVLVSITPTFFTKNPLNFEFADLHYEFANHIGCMERSTGNRTLWVYFSRDQHGDYFLTVNGPLTVECKNQMALEFHQLLKKLLEREEQTVAELLA